MTTLMLLVTFGSFAWFFKEIGMQFFAIVPIICFVVYLSYYTNGLTEKIKNFNNLDQFLILIARLIMMLGLGLGLSFFGVNNIDISLSLISLNLIFWIGSYITQYIDGKKIFQLGFYISILFLIIIAWQQSNISDFVKIFSMIWLMHTAILGFIIFVVGILYDIERYMRYKLAISTIGAMIILFAHQINDIYIALSISSLFLTGVYRSILKILKNKPPSEEQVQNISIRRILAGEKINQHKTQYQTDYIKQIYAYLINVPVWVKFALEGINIVIIGVMIIIYIQNIGIKTPILHEWLYRLLMVNFVSNVLILKKINYTSIIQRLMLFTVINFAVYVSLFGLLDGNVGQIVRAAVLWNIFCSIIMFYTPKLSFGQYFFKIDYIFWMITTIVAMVINIILFNSTSVPGQLLFSIIFLYIGIQAMILFYAIRYIGQME